MKASLTVLLMVAVAAFGFVALDAQAAGACGSCGCGEADKAAQKAPKSFDQPPKVGDRATCPVMGGEFTVTEKTERSEHKGKHVVFCCAGCKPQFDKNPEKFL